MKMNALRCNSLKAFVLVCLFAMAFTGCRKEEDNIIADGDGNPYTSVKIGNQEWLKENIKTTKFNDGSNIQMVSDNNAWMILTTAAYCWYDNNLVNKSTYGALYNWYAVNTGKLCPSGWHVPTQAEWISLFNFLGGESVAGGKLKEPGTAHWESPNTDATNESGFTALPGGYRYEVTGTTHYQGEGGYWWTSSEESSTNARRFSLYNDYASVFTANISKIQGASVRCIKD